MFTGQGIPAPAGEGGLAAACIWLSCTLPADHRLQESLAALKIFFLGFLSGSKLLERAG